MAAMGKLELELSPELKAAFEEPAELTVVHQHFNAGDLDQKKLAQLARAAHYRG